MRKALLACIVIAGCGAPMEPADDSLGQAASSSPYPPSQVFQGIDWDFNITRLAGGPGLDGSDLWAMAWAGNGDLYGVWGDGKGVGENSSSPASDKAFMGLSKFVGSPPPTEFGTHPTATNVWGGIGTTNPNRYTDGTIAYGKGNTLLSVIDDLGNDVFVIQMAVQNSARAFIGQQVIYSLDEGKTWTRIPNTGTFPLCGGLLFGPGTTGVPASLNGYTYGYLDQGNSTGTLLCREPTSDFSKANIANLAAHSGNVEWFTGLDSHGNPIWGSVSKAKGVIDDVRTESTVVTYDPEFSRYIAFYEFNRPTSGDDTPIGPMAVLDAPNPWGPWTTVGYYQNWGGSALAPAIYNLGLTMLPNWLGPKTSNGTQSFCVVFSGVHDFDAFNLLCNNELVVRGSPPPPPGLVADWKLNEGSGNTAHDSSGHGNTGTLVAGPTWVSGRNGQPALSFNGSTEQYVDVGDLADLQLTGSMTVSAWFEARAFSTTADMPIVSKRGYSPNRGWQLYTDGNNVAFDVAVDGSTYVARYASPNLNTGTWYHVVGVFDAPAKTLDIYCNGQLVDGTLWSPSSAAIPSSQFNSGLHVNLGRSAGANPGQLFDGEVGEVRIYNEALTAAEVQAIP
jgi:hypothetical protein